MGKELEKGKVSTIRGRSPSADGSAAQPPPAPLPTPPGAAAAVGKGRENQILSLSLFLSRQSMKMLWKLTDNIKYEECEVSASPGRGKSPGPAAASGSPAASLRLSISFRKTSAPSPGFLAVLQLERGWGPSPGTSGLVESRLCRKCVRKGKQDPAAAWSIGRSSVDKAL